MAAITKERISKLYGFAARLGLVESGNKEDDFHQLVYAITKKSSIRKLTEIDYKNVRNRLLNDLNAKKEDTADRMSQAQIKKAWSLMYQIIEYSPSTENQTAGQRMCGAIKKILEIDADVKNPFAWISTEQGNKLIEMLKRYLKTEKAKKEKGA